MWSFRRIIILFLISVGLVHCQHFPGVTLKKNPKIGFIIGPGGARSLSAIGILKVFEEYDIPIKHVVGIGWGAWIAALYAKNQSLTEVRWSFYKLSKSGFFGTSILKSPLKAKSLSTLQENIKENFSTTKTKIPFSCPIMTDSYKKIWKTQNNLMSAVRSCLPLPPFFKVSNYTKTSPLSIEDSIQYLKKKGMNLIVWINPLEKGALFPSQSSHAEIKIFWKEVAYNFNNIKNTASVIKLSPSLSSYSMGDFSKIDSIIATGEKVGYSFVKRLKRPRTDTL